MKPNTIADVWKWVDQRGPDDCWPWTSSRSANGYGTFKIGSRSLGAHRVVYEAATGAAPGALFVCHRCDNRSCCNPAHLFLGTHTDNMRDKTAKGRSGAPQGSEHPFARLTEAQVSEIRARWAAGTRGRGRELAAEYGVAESTICGIAKGRRWKHVPVAA